ncbi:hypothetical protein BDN67DRAFT_970184 [Paxillus ammoniavirescens]|nr:hypothetical protein BDN67DRAFT_970184 [Paxillus ammoniavirescens]
MGLITGGYILEHHQVKEWADKRFPGAIKWGDPNHVHWPINNHLNKLYNDPEDVTIYQRCIFVPWEQNDVRVCFPAVWKRGRSVTRNKHEILPENDFARARKKELFEQVYEELPYLKEIPFVTVYDPFYTEGP